MGNPLAPGQGDSQEIYYKICLGDGYLKRPDIKKNLMDSKAALRALANPNIKKYVVVDHPLDETDKAFLHEHGYEEINILDSPPEFFTSKIDNESEPYNWKEHIVPTTREFFPDYGRRSDILRLLLLREKGFYSDTDEILTSDRIEALKKLSKQGHELTRNQESNSILYASKCNSSKVEDLLRGIYHRLVKTGYSKYLTRHFNLIDELERDKRILTKRDLFTIFATGPGQYKDKGVEECEDIFSHSNLTWIRPSAREMVKRLNQQKPKLTEQEIFSRIEGTLIQDSLVKSHQVNLAKLIYILGELTGLDEKRAEHEVLEIFERVKEMKPEWGPESIHRITAGATAKDMAKILKYKKPNTLNSNERDLIVQKFCCEDSKALPEEWAYLYDNIIRHGDMELLNKVQEKLGFLYKRAINKGTLRGDEDYFFPTGLDVLVEAEQHVFESVSLFLGNLEIEKYKNLEYQVDIQTGKIINVSGTGSQGDGKPLLELCQHLRQHRNNQTQTASERKPPEARLVSPGPGPGSPTHEGQANTLSAREAQSAAKKTLTAIQKYPAVAAAGTSSAAVVVPTPLVTAALEAPGVPEGARGHRAPREMEETMPSSH